MNNHQLTITGKQLRKWQDTATREFASANGMGEKKSLAVTGTGLWRVVSNDVLLYCGRDAQTAINFYNTGSADPCTEVK